MIINFGQWNVECTIKRLGTVSQIIDCKVCGKLDHESCNSPAAANPFFNVWWIIVEDWEGYLTDPRGSIKVFQKFHFVVDHGPKLAKTIDERKWDYDHLLVCWQLSPNIIISNWIERQMKSWKILFYLIMWAIISCWLSEDDRNNPHFVLSWWIWQQI